MMKRLLTIVFILTCFVSYGQDKRSYIHLSRLIEIEGAEFVVATIDDKGTLLTVNERYLLFINALTGPTHQVNFLVDAYIKDVEQVKIDSLGINKVLVSAKTVDADSKKGIEWDEPTQIIIFSPDGKERTQLTDDQFLCRHGGFNNKTGTIVIAGYYDSNNDKRRDENDRNEILIFDLKTLKLVTKL